MVSISESGDDAGPQMYTIQPLTGMRLTGGSVGLGVLGAGIFLSGIINFHAFGWRIAFVLPAACACFGLAALNLRAAFKLAQLRVENADKQPTKVPMRVFWRWLAANAGLFTLAVALCWLSSSMK